MKLSRKFLVLASAALVGALPSARADVTIKYKPASPSFADAVLTGAQVGMTNLSGPGLSALPTAVQQIGLRSTESITVGGSTTLSVTQLIDATTNIKILSADYSTQIDAGNFAALPTMIKTGGATLQYNSFSDIDYFKNSTFVKPQGGSTTLPNDLRLQSGYSGMIVVNQGVLQVSGFINQWTDYDSPNNIVPNLNPRMFGAAAVILQGSATLSFQGTPYNVVEKAPELTNNITGDPSVPLKFRLNYVHNLFAGTQADFLAGNVGTGVFTVLDVGKDADYIVDLHIDDGVLGSVGRIDGAGRLYKTGLGNFTILNSSRLTGDVFIGGGDLILSDPNNQALSLASSVNLIGADGTQNIAPNDPKSLTRTASNAWSTGALEWRPGYLDTRRSSTLAITTDQTIRNFQSLWNEKETNMWIAGTGAGTVVDVAPGTSLTILQDLGHDGYYTGSINGGNGRFVKDGVGALALMGQGSTIGEIDINGGRIISNVQSLGYGRVVIGAAGTLNIVQNNAGTLRALINGSAGSQLVVSPKESISSTVSDNWPSSNIPPDVGNGQLGVIDIYNQQRDFYGTVLVKDGITLAFSFGKDDTFINAKSVVLDSGATATSVGRETAIRFNDTTQRVNNLSGDSNTRIELGRGTITLNHDANTTYAGKVTGAGNLIKVGNGSMTLAGLNSYYGATVVRTGILSTPKADGMINSSGLVVGTGATFIALANTTFGSLFGQATSSVVVANGATLTIGKTAFQLDQLNNALSNFPGQSPDENPAYFLQTNDGVSQVNGMSRDNTVGFLRTSLGELDEVKPVGYAGASLIVKNTFGVSVGQTITGTGIATGTTVTAVTAAPSSLASQSVPGTVLPLASTAGFLVGMPVVGTGIPDATVVTAVSAGSITLSAATSIAATGVITGTSTVALSAAPTGVLAGTYTLSPVTTDNEVLTFRGVISGNGGLTKVGDQTLVLGGINTYTGVTNVNGGTLEINYNSLLGTSAINVGIDGTLAVNIGSGSQNFDKLVSGLGSFAKLGSGTLVVDAGTSLVTGTVHVAQGELRITNTKGLGTLAAFGVDVSAGAVYSVNTEVDATWGGSITGSGTMVKTGAGKLSIAGAFGLSADAGEGLVNVRGGALQAYSLPANYFTSTYGTVNLERGTTFRDTVVQTTATQSVPGVLVQVSSTAGLSIGQTVMGTGIQPGSKIVALTASSITLDLPTTLAANGLVSVDEVFGDNFTGDIIATNFNASTSTTRPVFEKAGNGSLTIGTQLSFDGDVVVLGGTLAIGANDALNLVNSVDLHDGTTLSVPLVGGAPASLNLNNLTGAANSKIEAPSAQLTISARAGDPARTYLGQITGGPTITFNEIRNPGDTTSSYGTLRLIRATGLERNFISRINVDSGILVGNLAGFGGAELHVNSNATIGFDNDNVATPLTYTSQVFGTGRVLKTGRGKITLDDGTALVSAYEVAAGTLVIRDGRLNPLPPELITASIAQGATLEVILGGGLSRTLGTQVAGTGNLVISNATNNLSEVTFSAISGLASISLGDFVQLSQGVATSIPGISGTAGSELVFDNGGAVQVNQLVNTEFVGTLSGVTGTRLTVVGPARASFTNQALGSQQATDVVLQVGTTSAPGNLEIDSRYASANASMLELVKGTLAVRVLAASPATFTAALSGADNSVKFIKTGDGDLNVAASVSLPVFSSYEIEAGRLITSFDSAGKIFGGRPVSVIAGSLVLQQGGTNVSLSLADIPTTGANSKIEVAGLGGATTGKFSLLCSTAGALELVNSADVSLGLSESEPITIGKQVTVGVGSTLRGQAIIGTSLANANLVNNGTVAPGYSPGIVTVNGNVTNTGVFVMELSATLANGTYNDQILFTGTANLNNSGNNGKITLKQYDDNPSTPVAPAFGKRFVLFKDTSGADANSFTSLLPAANISFQGAHPFRYVLSYPTDASGQVGEFAVYVVRDRADYDAFKAPASLLDSIKSITQVNSVLVTSGITHDEDVYQSTPAASYNSVGAGLAILGDAALQTALDNLTPYGASGTVTAAGTLFQQNINNAARRLELRRFDRSSLTILSNEWYVDTIGGKATVGANGELQNQATTYGVTAGLTKQVGVDGVAGFSLTAEHFSLSSDTATRASGTGFAGNAFIGTVALRGQLSLDAGLSIAHLSSTITRDSVIGSGNTNASSPSALTYGVWGRLGTVVALKSSDTFITPFIGVQFSSTKLSSLAESGQADAMAVSSGSISQSSVRAGAGFHHMWEEGRGDWRYRLSLDLGYVKQLTGEFGDFTSTNSTGINTTYTSSLRVNAGSGFYASPSLNFGPNENSTFSIGLSYEQGNGNSLGVNAGYRKRF